MGSLPIKSNENIYFRCRKDAALENDRLNSRENAAELLGVSVSSLADYELGNTKVVPVDKVVLMSELYNAPQLKSWYCSTVCPIGKDLPIATQIHSFELTTLKILSCLSADKLNFIKNQLICIAADGVIEEMEKPALEEILGYLDELTVVIGELRLLCQKNHLPVKPLPEGDF